MYKDWRVRGHRRNKLRRRRSAENNNKHFDQITHIIIRQNVIELLF